ncbi:MAG: 3-isopropylmalate dehydratase small subunit [Gammaproteobacteria bacterium]|nr:3-isopropylmalate dehydratase small subunit [Gammaproteobacteria bacterium]
MEPLTQLTSKTVVLPNADIDTDQIIPARFLTTTESAGLGQHAFSDWRFDSDGSPKPDFVLNRPEAGGCEVLVAGDNFGCGSSREHAAWALRDFGFRAVISTTIADIFRSNALKNGIVPVEVDTATQQWLFENPGAEVTIDIGHRQLQLPDGRRCEFAIDDFARYCLLYGVDPLGHLLSQEKAINDYERAHHCTP